MTVPPPRPAAAGVKGIFDLLMQFSGGPGTAGYVAWHLSDIPAQHIEREVGGEHSAVAVIVSYSSVDLAAAGAEGSRLRPSARALLIAPTRLFTIFGFKLSSVPPKEEMAPERFAFVHMHREGRLLCLANSALMCCSLRGRIASLVFRRCGLEIAHKFLIKIFSCV